MYALWTVVSIHAVKSHPVNDAIKFSILLAGCAHDHLKMDKYSYAFRDYSNDTGLKRQLVSRCASVTTLLLPNTPNADERTRQNMKHTRASPWAEKHW